MVITWRIRIEKSEEREEEEERRRRKWEEGN